MSLKERRAEFMSDFDHWNYEDSTLDGTTTDSIDQIPDVCKSYMERRNDKWIPIWSKDMIDRMLTCQDQQLSPNDYPDSGPMIAQACAEYVRGKDCAVIGSISPWIECILLKYNARNVTTVDYNPPVCDYIIQTDTGSKKFDVIVSFSSIEHSGLGRYGDPIDPDGDLKACMEIHDMLHEGGYFICGVPIGEGCIEGNFHRIYNRKRIEKLFKPFEMVRTVPENLDFSGADWKNQPIFIMRRSSTIV